MLATIEWEYFANKQTMSAFYWNSLSPCEVSNEANDAVLAYRLWEISEAMLIDRTNSFDTYLQIGDEFSSYVRSEDTPDSLSKSSSIDQAEADQSLTS